MHKINDSLKSFINIQKNKIGFYRNKNYPKNEINHNNDIILIGPPGVGKSTVSQLLGKHLELPVVPIDKIRWKYFNELGYSTLKKNKLEKKGGFKKVYKYWKPFEAYTVKRVVNEYKNCIFDFGGGFSVYNNKRLFKIVQQSLEKYKNIFLLLPSEDKTISLNLINSRSKSSAEINGELLNSPCNKKLAKHIIYVNDKTPNQVCDEIISTYNKQQKDFEQIKQNAINFDLY